MTDCPDSREALLEAYDWLMRQILECDETKLQEYNDCINRQLDADVEPVMTSYHTEIYSSHNYALG